MVGWAELQQLLDPQRRRNYEPKEPVSCHGRKEGVARSSCGDIFPSLTHVATARWANHVRAK